MRIELTSAQREVLLGLVDEAIRDLGPEIHHTVIRTYKDDLRDLRQNLGGLRGLLSGTGSAEGTTPATKSSELVGSP